VAGAVSPRQRAAERLFAPIGPTYDRYARLLSFGQDPRWRAFLVSRVEAGPESRVLDVATGTAAVAMALARGFGCRVVGVDQSAGMLASARARVAAAGLGDRIELVEGRAESLPFDDGSFDALTFTYLLRYVDEPGETLRELARVVRPGGVIASLEFGVPSHPWRWPWELWVRIGLPAAGRLISPGWADVGSFLGGSIRDFAERLPPDALERLWREAGVDAVERRELSLGGGVVTWGRRA
jgi:demethylmenaquinone methyltransferase/2-methoxy-6-polyprenyl-1,4-benzoquinol methylase